jgi:HSP20 family protein
LFLPFWRTRDIDPIQSVDSPYQGLALNFKGLQVCVDSLSHVIVIPADGINSANGKIGLISLKRRHGSGIAARVESIQKEGDSMSGLHWQRRWDPFRELQREVGRLFESLDPFQSARRAHVYPPLNLYDAGERYILSAQLPGVATGEIDLTITGETLTMRGERKRAEGIKDDSYRRQERPIGRWSRTVTLPDRVDSTQVSASFANGILTVSLPKAESAKPRHITVVLGG